MNRKLLFAVLVAGTAVVAGCTSGTDNDATTPTPAANTNTPPPASDALKQQALALFTSKPFNTNTPEHTCSRRATAA